MRSKPKFLGRPRPVLINNWEGTYFRFNERKLLEIARTAKSFGIEEFVLDDGWFGDRNDDYHALGDYDVNKKKLPHGLKGLAKRINRLGLGFGLWVEPEAISPKSKLYEKHPDWCIHAQGVIPSLGRNELLLDLTKECVQDYIISSLIDTIGSANINYIKWDMNRNMSDIGSDTYNAGEFYHRYIMGLYRIVKTLTKKFPDVLFENCASGGNRFDLGMLSFFPQTWASDDTDPYERISIQEGLSLGYPLSTISAHVSHRINHQMLRSTPYSSKFDVAVFGVLGYELMLNELTPAEKKDIKNQIAFYKAHRELFQYGDFYRIKTKDFEGDSASWMVINRDRTEAVIGIFNGLQSSRPHETILRGYDFIPGKKYTISVFDQPHELKMFGNLVNMVLPIHINSDGILMYEINKHRTMGMEKEEYLVDGKQLNVGIILKSEWAGNGYSDNVRIMGDFGTRIYYVKSIEGEKEDETLES